MAHCDSYQLPPWSAFGNVFALNVHAHMLNMASQSVKSRRRRQPLHSSTLQRPVSELCQSPSAAMACATMDRTNVMQYSEDVELLRSARQSTVSMQIRIGPPASNTSPSSSSSPSSLSLVRNERRRRSGALDKSIRRSRDLHYSRQVAELLQRPLPPLPLMVPEKEARVPSVGASPNTPVAAPRRPKRSPIRSTAALPELDDDDDDWAAFISDGYRLFPQPPTTTPSPKARIHRATRSSIAHEQERVQLLPVQPQNNQAHQLPSAQRTGIDWLDEELSWISSDEEGAQTARVPISTDKTIPSRPVDGVPPLSRSLSTPPSTSVDTFTHHTIAARPSQIKAQWRMSNASDIFVTPTSSPQLDLGTMQFTHKANKTVSGVKRAHVPMFFGLSHAVAQYAAETAAADKVVWQQHYLDQIHHGDDDNASKDLLTTLSDKARRGRLSEGEQDTFDALMVRHDSVSSVGSNVSQDFSSISATSTRASSLADELDMVRSPPKPEPAVPRNEKADNVPTMSRQRRHRKGSDAAEQILTASQSRRRSSSRAAWPSGKPEPPMRMASLQALRQHAQANGSHHRRESEAARQEDEGPAPRDIHPAYDDSDDDEATIEIDLSTVTDRRRAPAQETSPQAPPKEHSMHYGSNPVQPKSGIRSLFGRQRRQSSGVVLDGPLTSSPARPTAQRRPSEEGRRGSRQSIVAGTMMGLPRTSSHFLRQMADRPLADVPVTPTATEDVPAPTSAIQESRRPSLASRTAAAILAKAPGHSSTDEAIHAPTLEAVEGMRAFAAASSADRRQSVISTSAMPNEVASGTCVVARQPLTTFTVDATAANATSTLGRRGSLRGRALGLMFEYDPASPFYVAASPEAERRPSIPLNSASSRPAALDPTTPCTVAVREATSPAHASFRMGSNGGSGGGAAGKHGLTPPVTFWHRGGARLMPVTDGDLPPQADDAQATITIPVQRGCPDRTQGAVRRVGSVTLWR